MLHTTLRQFRLLINSKVDSVHSKENCIRQMYVPQSLNILFHSDHRLALDKQFLDFSFNCPCFHTRMPTMQACERCGISYSAVVVNWKFMHRASAKGNWWPKTRSAICALNKKEIA